MKIILFANTDWYLYNFRRSLAIALQDRGHEVVLVSPDGPYGEKLTGLGFRWVPAPMDRRSLDPFKELALLGWLWRLARREKPDLIHGFTIKSAIYGALAARMVGAGSVNAVAGIGYVFTSNELRARLLRPLVKAFMTATLGRGKRSRLILQNPDDRRFFEQEGIVPSSRIRLIPGSGVDCSRFVAPSVERIPTRRSLRVALAARLLWDKGLAEYIEAARTLKAQGRKLHFLLAGSPDPGNPDSVAEETILDWQHKGLVQWLGHVEDMPTFLASVDIVVLPSYYGEGLPKTLIEAAACGRALVTTDMPGCREVVTDEVDGLLVPARDAQSLARAIARLQDDPNFAQRLGQAARRKALAQFDERIVIARTLAVYDEVVKTPQPLKFREFS